MLFSLLQLALIHARDGIVIMIIRCVQAGTTGGDALLAHSQMQFRRMSHVAARASSRLPKRIQSRSEIAGIESADRRIEGAALAFRWRYRGSFFLL